jgi:peroxiredoxin
MSQAEIAGGRLLRPGELPKKGVRLDDLELELTSGGKARLSDYDRANLVIVLSDRSEATRKLITDLIRIYQQLKTENAQLIVICSRQDRDMEAKPELSFPVTVDTTGLIHRKLGATSNEGQCSAAIYVTDRYREIYGVYRMRDGQRLPGTAEILEWLQFINSQCPECEPPEWPV